MIKKSAAKVNTLFSPRPHKERGEDSTQEEDTTDLEEDLELSDNDDGCQSSDRSGERDTPEKVSSEDSLKKQAPETLQEEIRKIIIPLLDDRL